MGKIPQELYAKIDMDEQPWYNYKIHFDEFN